MIKPLAIKNTIFPVNIIQGPLAGISSAPFRLLTWRYSQPAFTCTEMISCKTIIQAPSVAAQRLMTKYPEEGPVCFQLSANNPQELAEAARRVTDYGADLIDLNCGCPVKKIRTKGAGSRLLTDPLTLYKLIVSLKQNTHLPVSIKIRVQGESDEKFNAEIAKVVSEGGADCLIVHGRHWTEHYETPCRHDQIQFFVHALSIPVIGNGDIANLESLQTMFATGCAGVMIARAGVGKPWLIKKLMAEMHQEKFSLPSLAEMAEILIEHVMLLEKLLQNEKATVFQARQFAKYYARTLAKRDEFSAAINQCTTIHDLNILCRNYFN